MFCNVNGKLCNLNQADISIRDRGLLLGDGLFETMRVGMQILHFQQHWQRLQHSARKILLSLPFDDDQLHREITELLQANQLRESSIRLTVTRGNADRGLVIHNSQPNYFVTQAPLSETSKPLVLVIATCTRKNQYSPLAQLKSTNYLEHILARQEASARQADDAILLNTAEKITETTVANIFLVKNEQLLTPKLTDGVLPGVMRAVVFNLAQAMGINIREKTLSTNDLLQADEVFITNSLIRINSVAQIEDRQFSSFKMAEQLLRHYLTVAA